MYSHQYSPRCQNLIFFSLCVLRHFLANTATIYLLLFNIDTLFSQHFCYHIYLYYHWSCFILYYLCLFYSNFTYWNNSSGCSLISVPGLQSQSMWAYPISIICILRSLCFCFVLVWFLSFTKQSPELQIVSQMAFWMCQSWCSLCLSRSSGYALPWPKIFLLFFHNSIKLQQNFIQHRR